MKKIKEEVRKELRDSVSNEVIDDYLRNCSNSCMLSLLKSKFNIKDRYETIKSKQVEDLSTDEKLIVNMYYMM